MCPPGLSTPTRALKISEPPRPPAPGRQAAQTQPACHAAATRRSPRQRAYCGATVGRCFSQNCTPETSLNRAQGAGQDPTALFLRQLSSARRSDRTYDDGAALASAAGRAAPRALRVTERPRSVGAGRHRTHGAPSGWPAPAAAAGPCAASGKRGGPRVSRPTRRGSPADSWSHGTDVSPASRPRCRSGFGFDKLWVFCGGQSRRRTTHHPARCLPSRIRERLIFVAPVGLKRRSLSRIGIGQRVRA